MSGGSAAARGKSCPKCGEEGDEEGILSRLSSTDFWRVSGEGKNAQQQPLSLRDQEQKEQGLSDAVTASFANNESALATPRLSPLALLPATPAAARRHFSPRGDGQAGGEAPSAGAGGCCCQWSPRPALRLAEARSTASCTSVSSEIVLFKGEAVVLYSRQLQRVLPLKLHPKQKKALLERALPRCSLCGQRLDNDSRLSFEAQFYFQMLQELLACVKQTQAERAAPPSGMQYEESRGGEAEDFATVPSNPYIRHRQKRLMGEQSFVDQSIPRSLLITGYYGRFFREIGLLGSGGYGSVYLTEHVLDGLALGFFAVKKTPVGDNRAWLQKTLREIKVRERLTHPNIADYKHSWLELHSANELCPQVPWLFILMEFCNAGDLEALINFVYEGNAAVAVAEEVAETSRLAAAASAAEGGAAAERLGSAASEAAANARASLSAAVPIHVAAAATAAAAASAAAAAVCAAPAKTGTPRSEARELRNSPLAQVSSEAAAAAAAAAASCCFSSWHVWRLLLDVIFGLQHLHNAGVVYRDMKPSNVLLDCPGALRAEEALFASPPSSPAASAQPMGVDAAADCAAAEAGPEDSKEGGGARASGSRKAWPSSQEDAGGGGAPEVAVPPMQRIRAVLADFGTAARCGYTRASSGEKGGALRRDRGFSGTVEFTAPELFGSEEEHEEPYRYDTKGDLWSLGVIAFCLCYGSPPFSAATPEECRDLIRSCNNVTFPKVPLRPSSLKLLIEALMQKDPQQRPSCDDLLTSGPLQAALAERANLLQATEELLLLLLLQRRQRQQRRNCPRKEAAIQAAAARARAAAWAAARSSPNSQTQASPAASQAALLPPPDFPQENNAGRS